MYTRQSQDRTGDELGISRQRDDALSLARTRGLNVVREHADNDVSASGRRRRPGFEALLADLDSGRAQVVVAWDLTRLTRNPRDTVRLLEVGERRGITIALVRGSDMDLSTPAGRLTASVLASVARHEIEQKSDRQRRAALQAAEQGRRVGGRRPFGYEQDGQTVRESEASAIRDAYTAVLEGVPLAQVAADWNSRGLHTPQASRDGSASTWTGQTVGPVLLNPRYAGLRSHVTARVREQYKDPRKARIAGIVGQAAWDGLVSEDTWRAVVEVLTDPARSHPGRTPQALLTGVGLCGLPGDVVLKDRDGQEAARVCGHTVHRGGASPASGGRYPTYRCSGPVEHLVRKAEPVDDWIGMVVVERLSRPDARLLLQRNTGPDVAVLRREVKALRKRLDGLATLLADEVLTEAGVRRESARLKAKIAETEQLLADNGRVDVLGPLIEADDKQAAWDALDTARQRLVVDTLMIVALRSTGRGTRTFRPESVEIIWR
ncbi:recombinase family protein [Catellatospora bangladeshensis]|uniref:recombinase family protein n=1 Tax=Catellatospora bangladeshensis TaxID=310355 RepID=UPI0036197AF6